MNLTTRAEVERKLEQHLGIPKGYVAPEFLTYWIGKGLTAEEIVSIAGRVPPPCARKDS